MLSAGVREISIIMLALDTLEYAKYRNPVCF